MRDFSVCLPLKKLLGFAEDYKKVIFYARQTLTLLRSSTDKNSYRKTDPAKAPDDAEFKINEINWYVPFITPGDKEKLHLLGLANKSAWLSVPFRTWELAEHSSMPDSANSHTWAIKSSSQLEKPRYVIVGFQTDRKENLAKNAAEFDTVNLRDVKLFIDDECYPYINLNLDFSKSKYAFLYHMYATFRESYYQKCATPPLSIDEFRAASCGHRLFPPKR